MNLFKLSFLLLLFLTNNSFANKAEVAKNFGISVNNISSTPINGLYEIIQDANIFYVSTDSKYLIQGDIIDLKTRINITQVNKDKIISKALNSIPDSEKIIFKAKDEKFVVNVFTDVDCPFCKRLHQHMSGYNKLGITVKYLAAPIASLHPKALARMESIWCADDRQKAIDVYKKTNKVVTKTCPNNPVKKQLALSQELGVRGTPTIFLTNGRKIPGYIKPRSLLAELKK